MRRYRGLWIVLTWARLLFSACVKPLMLFVKQDAALALTMSLYFALGIFLLIAVRNPSAHRSLIAFAAWSSFAHAAVMSILGLEIPSQPVGFLIASYTVEHTE